MGAQALPKTAQAFSVRTPQMNMTSRPLVQELVKQAMANSVSRAKIAAEGSRQLKLAGENKCGGCQDPECGCHDKKASADGSISTDYAMKLAAAIEYATPVVLDMSKKAAPNAPPARITETQQTGPEGVSQSAVSGTPPGPGQQGHGHAQPPTNPGTQRAMPQEHGATQLENTINEHVSGEQTTAMSGGKGKTAEALFENNLGALSKLAKKDGERKAPLAHRMGEAVGRHADTMSGVGGSVMGALGGAGAGGAIGHGLGGTKGAIAGMALGAAGGGTGGFFGGRAVGRGMQGMSKGMAEAHRTRPKYEGIGTKEDVKDAKEKKGSAQLSLVDDFLGHVKQAEDAINPANISAGPAVPPDTNASGEAGGAPVGGMPQGPSSLIGSNESAINYKKQTAYSPRKSELAQYFNEPAMSAATDRTLHEAFAHTGEAGVKISAAQLTKSAAARALLAKMAGEEKAAEKEKDEALYVPTPTSGPIASRIAKGTNYAAAMANKRMNFGKLGQ